MDGISDFGDDLMTNTEKREAFPGCHSTYEVAFKEAIELSKDLDCESNYDRGELPLFGAPVLQLLGIYGVLAHKASSKPKNQKLAVVVWPPQVFFCPSKDGLDGVFVEPYSEEKHGKNCFVLHKDSNIWDFGSVDALRDGWTFCAEMVNIARDLE